MKFILQQLDINDKSVNVEISRSNFNELCKDLFDKAMEMVERALRTAKISAEQINYVVILLLEKQGSDMLFAEYEIYRFWLADQLEFQEFKSFCRINLVRQN